MDILFVIAEIVLLVCIVIDLIYIFRNIKYQKIWNKKKADIIAIDLAITTAELCEIYVRFCKKNKCKVDF